jgi:hypothetical protein
MVALRVPQVQGDGLETLARGDAHGAANSSTRTMLTLRVEA